MLGAAESEVQQRCVAGAFSRRGLASGDRVAFLLHGSTQLVTAVLGALRAGIVPVMLDPALAPVERGTILDDADPALVIDTQAGLDSLFRAAPAELAPVPLARPMHYTSGTSGRRKGVWTGVLGMEDAGALVDEEREQWGFTASDVHLVSSALYHSAPLRFATSTLLAGGAISVLSKFDAAAWADRVAQLRPTTLFLAPAHLQRIFAAVDEGMALPDLRDVRLLAYAGAPCPRPLQERLHAALPPGSVWEFYGSTEGQFTACSPSDWAERPGSVGRARPGRALSVDPDGTIWCAVPSHARFEYWRDAEKTRSAWRGDSFTVGDIGRLDDDGFLYLDGRREDLILSGGVNVYPREVEMAFEGCPGLADMVVVGRPDERWGERVVAVAVGDVGEAQLREWAGARLGPARRPKQYIVVDEIPRSSTGKVRRQFLLGDLGVAE